MGMDKDCGKESINPVNILRYIKFRYQFYRNSPDYFNADGLLCFVGPQGSGKTISAVNYVYKLMQKYPLCKLCTNLYLEDYPLVTFEEFKKERFLFKDKDLSDADKYRIYLQENRVFPFTNNDDFKKYSNNKKGFIFLVDEIHLYMNSLESKNINMDTMTQIAQQRKQRKHIVATSQVYGRMAKPLREQFSNVIVCSNYLGFIQRNRLIDRDSLEEETSADTQIKGKVKKQFIWLHNPEEMYRRYDTYYVIDKNSFVSGEKMKEGVYGNDNYVRLPSNR